VRLLKILLIVVDGLLKVGPGKAKKKSLKNYGIFSQKRCMNPVTTMVVTSGTTNKMEVAHWTMRQLQPFQISI
jgi:hypothetical protein